MTDNFIGALDFGTPEIDGEAFVAPTAVVVGAVTMGPRSSIWYGAVARADAEVIEIGADSNIQDGCTLHSDPGFPLVVGTRVRSATGWCCTARGSTTTCWSAWAASS